MIEIIFIAVLFAALLIASVMPIVIYLKLSDLDQRMWDVEHALTKIIIGDFGPEDDDPAERDRPTIPQRIRAIATQDSQVAA